MDLHLTAFLVLIAPKKKEIIGFFIFLHCLLFSSREEHARNFDDEWVKTVEGEGPFVKVYPMHTLVPCALASWSVLS